MPGAALAQRKWFLKLEGRNGQSGREVRRAKHRRWRTLYCTPSLRVTQQSAAESAPQRVLEAAFAIEGDTKLLSRRRRAPFPRGASLPRTSDGSMGKENCRRPPPA